MVYNIIMKRLWFDRKEVKRGVASLYVVLFATILFGVVTLSFMRIILSEAGQSSDDDLSQSAYDSAMAGVEDAKRAVNRYYDCLGRGGTAASCNAAALFTTNCENGIGLAKYLYGENYGSNETGWEVKIQETEVGTGNVDNESDQAYTCVVISDTVPDYRGTLTADTRTRVIPLAVFDGDSHSSTGLNALNKIQFKWYSRLNVGTSKANDFKLRSGGDLEAEATVPPTIQLTFIHISSDISHANFDSANNGLDYTTMLLLPSSDSGIEGNSNLVIAQDVLRDSGNAKKNNKDDTNQPFKVKCYDTTEFACTVELNTGSFGNQDSVFLVASLPYGDTMTDFAVSMHKSDNSTIDLVGSQISVDSTGRTNQLVRRVETRLDPADLYFPYPMYALDLGDGGDEALKKNFWITANCWYSQPNQLHSGDAQVCTDGNNGQL